MPELPEVEAIARTLRPLAVGRKIRYVHAFHTIAVKPQTATALARSAEGKTIRSVERHGKFLLLGLNPGLLLLHFRFDWHLIWFLNAKALLTVANAVLDDERNSGSCRYRV